MTRRVMEGRWQEGEAPRARPRERPLPAIGTADGLVPGATLRAGARWWTGWLRARGAVAGDRVVCALPPGPAFVMLLVAALRDDLTFVPIPPSADLAPLAATVDARLVVAATGGDGVVVPEPAGTPPDGAPPFVRAGAPTPDARFLLRTSGTTGAARWIALSDANVRAVLASHAPTLALEGATVLSVLPWHHAFGLVLELLPALLAGATIVRDPDGGRDVDALLRIADAHPVTHLSAVPRTMQLLAARDEGRAMLARLRGGVVGGAPVDGALAAALAETRLRVGYGQTEASPGIALGAPGEWRAGILGRPVGCEVRVDDDGVLVFRGPNACLGEWRDGALARLPVDRWVRTGDLVRAEPDGGYTFEGRLAGSVKLANGRYVGAAAIERAVRTRFPAVGEAMLASPDGHALLLACSPAAGRRAHELPCAADVAPLLGPLATRPLCVHPVEHAAWVRTPKGELDRRYPTGRPTLHPRGAGVARTRRHA